MSEIKKELISIAARLVRGALMPSTCIEDWGLPKNTSGATKSKILDAAYRACEENRQIGIKLRDLADQID